MKLKSFYIVGSLAFFNGLALTVVFFLALQGTIGPSTTPPELATAEPTVHPYRAYFPAVLAHRPPEVVTIEPTPASAAGGPPEPSPTVEPSPVSSPVVITHVVQVGENLTQIAQMYDTTMGDIVEANDLEDANTIWVGQVLLIPSSATGAPGEEPTAEPVPTPLPTVGQKIHVVQQGETLSAIARAYGVTVEEIAQANGLDNPNAIFVGQTLVIP